VARLRVAPTRSNLLRMREALELAREGYEILDKKREVLTTQLMHVAHEASQLQQRVWTCSRRRIVHSRWRGYRWAVSAWSGPLCPSIGRSR